MRRYEVFRGVAKAALFTSLFAGSVLSVGAQSMMKASPSAASPAGAAAAAPDQVSVSGSISAISGATVFITAEDGTAKAVSIGKDTLILGRKLATLDSILPGEALGVAAIKGDDGSLTATVINVFPAELWQKVRKGQFPMANGQVMTNAQVDSVGAGVKGRTLLLKYEMLTAAIAVPESAEIHRSVSLKLGDLKVGEKVSVRGTASPSGMLAAGNVSLDLPDGS